MRHQTPNPNALSIFEVGDHVSFNPHKSLPPGVKSLFLLTGWKGTESYRVEKTGPTPNSVTLHRNRHTFNVPDDLLEYISTKSTRSN